MELEIIFFQLRNMLGYWRLTMGNLNWMVLTNKTVGAVLLIFGFIFFGRAWAIGEPRQMVLPFILMIIGLWLLWPKEK